MPCLLIEPGPKVHASLLKQKSLLDLDVVASDYLCLLCFEHLHIVAKRFLGFFFILNKWSDFFLIGQ